MMRLSATPPQAHHALRRVCVASGVLLVLMCLAPAAARAADDESDNDGVDTDTARPLATAYGVGLNGSPRVTRVDLAVATPSAYGLGGVQSLQPDSARLSDVSYRFWVSRGRTDVGVGVGALTLTARPLGATPSAAPNAALDNGTILLASAPSLTVGMRFRASPQSTLFADASGTRGLGLNNGDAYVGKVGIEWKPASLASRWNIAYGGIGWRLSADSRMTLRIRGGGLGLYIRSQF